MIENEQPEWSKVELDGSRRYQHDRRRYINIRKSKRFVNREGRLVNTVEYAIAWGVKNKPYSSKQLSVLCKDEEAPSKNFIMKTWKRFDNYYRDLCRHGMPPRPPRNDAERRRIVSAVSGKVLKNILITEDYELVKYVAKLNLDGKRSTYSQYRKDNPGQRPLLPCALTIARRFGSWKKFAYEVMKYNVDLIMTNYVEESMKAGHWLYLKECDKLGIPLRTAMNVLRPRFFNILCYRKMELLGGNLPKH